MTHITLDKNSIMLRLKRVRSKVSDAPSTISIPHPQPSESAFKHSQYSQKTRFLLLFENSKNYSKTTVMWKLIYFLFDIAAPVRPMELRKHFHRLTHICSIQSQKKNSTKCFLMSESYIVTLESV